MNDSLTINIHGERAEISPAMIEKYNQPGPRYTSYPTAPEWDDNFGQNDLQNAFDEAIRKSQPDPLSLYFHLPFCQSLCLFCGCNTVISKKHEVTLPYLTHLQREIALISDHLASSRQVKQLHWGGGTPTFLSPDEIRNLYTYIQQHFSFASDAELGIEVDPRATTEEHCRVLAELGFNRISMGIQDFNPLVQRTINRVQPYEMTRSLFDDFRRLGIESINVDLIYGLPHQTLESFGETIDKIIAMNPDRIAVFSYAHVPWLKKQQGSFAKHLPQGIEKFRIFHHAIERLTDAGYRYIGMDHFARPNDELCRAQDNRTLHRNFQGYTTQAGCDLLGMGVSSISALENVYAQNWRELPNYYAAISSGRWPTMRGLRVSADDKLRRSIINRLLCHCVVVKSEVEQEFNLNFDEYFAPELIRLRELEHDGMVRLHPDRIEVATLGRIFIRNVAMIFDAYLGRKDAQQKVFSKTL